MNTFLQIFLLANVFIMGILATLAAQHAYAHFKPKHRNGEPNHPVKGLTVEDRQKILEKSKANYETVLEKSAAELQHDLGQTGAQLNKVLNRLGTAIVGNELERYHADLEQIRKSAEAAINGAQTEIAGHQADLKAKLSTEVEAERQRLLEKSAAEQAMLIKQIDTRLADAVASFLLETLQHDVDLGAQTKYLTEMLEAHKDDFKKEVVQ